MAHVTLQDIFQAGFPDYARTHPLPWHVRRAACDPHGRGVITYRARSLRGAALKHARPVRFDGNQVAFRSHDHGDRTADGTGKVKLMPLAVSNFMQRVLLHVPASRTQVARFSGLYHHTQSARLCQCRAHRGQAPVVEPEEPDWQTYGAQRGEAHPAQGPTCGQRLVCSAIIPRGGAPSGEWSGEEAA